MNASRLFVAALSALALALGACSIEVSGLTPAAPAAITAAPTARPTALVPAATVSPDTPPPAASSAEPATTVVDTAPWAALHLSGKLVFTAGTQGVLQLDLVSGQLTTLFSVADPNTSWVVAAAVSPDRQQLVLAYAPPASAGQVQFGYTGLYLVPLAAAAAPQPLIAKPAAKVAFFEPTWSPDGRWLYYVRLSPPSSPTEANHLTVERMAYPGGQLEVVAKEAIWPRLSPDGTQLVYVQYDPLKTSNALFVAAPDGSQARQIALPANFQAIDAPMFSPDGKTLLFSVIIAQASAGQASAPLGWLDRLLGVRLAYADGNPADWWRVAVAGGQPEQLTHVLDTGLFGAFAPDGQRMAYLSGRGLYVIELTGANPVQLINIGDLPGSIGTGSVDWLP